MKRVRILWTGGYDSTFRISQLSRLDVEIEPYYLANDKRLSQPYELKAIREITEIFESSSDTKAKFLPLTYITMDQREEDETISEAYKRVKEKDFLGTQYDFLGVFAKRHPGIELSIHEDDTAIALIMKYGDLRKEHDDVIGDYYVVDESKTSEDIGLLFNNYHFPLAKYSKKQMKRDYKKYNLTEVMEKTWFCHSPIDGKPCGICNPCKYTIEEGLYNRLGKRALFRYALKKYKINEILDSITDFSTLFKNDLKKYLKNFKGDIKKYSILLKKDLKKYFIYCRTDYKNIFRNLKGDIRKYLKNFKGDIRKYGKFLKNSYANYIHFIKMTYKDLREN